MAVSTKQAKAPAVKAAEPSALNEFSRTLKGPQQLHPDVAAHLVKLREHGFTQLALGKPRVAAASLKFVCDAHADDAEAHKAYGSALAQVGQHKRAILVLRRALELGGDDIEVHCVLGELLIGLLDYQSGVAHLQSCLQLDPVSAHPHGVRARLLIRKTQRQIEQTLK